MTAKSLMKILKLFCFLICFLFISLEAAAPNTHVYFAQQWIDIHQMPEEDQNAFIIGTLFPDIRYLGTISRDKTHEKGVTPEKILVRKTLF